MYKAENIDTDMFLEGIRTKRNAQREKSIRKKIEADAYFSGYDQACFDIEGMFDCANYESPKVQSRTYRAGANDALYHLCKELNIPAEDLVNDWNTEKQRGTRDIKTSSGITAIVFMEIAPKMLLSRLKQPLLFLLASQNAVCRNCSKGNYNQGVLN